MKCTVMPMGHLRANCVILDDENGGALVADPGGRGSDIYALVRDRGLTVKGILLTHAHWDHTYGLAELQQLTGAPVYVGQGDAGLVDVPGKVPVREGDVIGTGEMSFRVMETPGHSMGSVLYISDSVILSGDTLFRRSIGRTDFEGSDPGLMEQSLERIKALDCGSVPIIPGHGPATTLDEEREQNPFL